MLHARLRPEWRTDSPGSMSVVRRNILWLLLSQGATWLVSIVLLVIVPGELGDALFGEVSFAAVYVSLFSLVATFGTAEFLTKTLARDTSKTGHYVFNTLLMKLVVSVGLSAVAIALAFALDFDRLRIELIAAYCLGMVVTVLNNVLLGGLQGLQQMGRPALLNAISTYVAAVVGTILLFNGGGIIGYVLAFNLAPLIALVGNAFGLRPALRSHGRIDPHVWKLVLTGGFPFFVLSALLVIYGSVDIPMIEAFSGTEAVGWYALAYRWISMPAVFAASIATALFPALSAEGIHVTPAFTRMANRAMYVVMIVATPVAVGIVLVADDFIPLLYGSEFAQAVPLMQLLALHIPIVGLDIVLGAVVVAADRQRQWVKFSVLAAVFNPLANLIAIPLADARFDNGAIGAAFTTVLTEFILMMAGIRLRPAGVFDRPTQRVVLRIVVASLAMVPIVLVLGSTSLYVQISAGVIAYVIASMLLKTASLNDLRDLRGGFSARRDVGADHEAAVGT